jgi:hypothetical protein
MSLMIDVNLTFGCTGVHDDINIEAGFRQVVQGEPSIGFGDDDDEQIVQCLEDVKNILDFTLCFACLIL